MKLYKKIFKFNKIIIEEITYREILSNGNIKISNKKRLSPEEYIKLGDNYYKTNNSILAVCDYEIIPINHNRVICNGFGYRLFTFNSKNENLIRNYVKDYRECKSELNFKHYKIKEEFLKKYKEVGYSGNHHNGYKIIDKITKEVIYEYCDNCDKAPESIKGIKPQEYINLEYLDNKFTEEFKKILFKIDNNYEKIWNYHLNLDIEKINFVYRDLKEF